MKLFELQDQTTLAQERKEEINYGGEREDG
jgi:hypothetical protein